MKFHSAILLKLNRFAAFFIRLGFGITILILLVQANLNHASAQSGDISSWQSPTNLSQSGSSTTPYLRIAPDGSMHVFWLDEFAGFIYRRGDGENWGLAQPVDLPFEVDVAKLDFQFASSTRLHAFWIDTEQNLLTANVATDFITVPTEWTLPLPLGSDVLDFEAAVDADGGVHLVYLRNTEDETSPAGIFYMQLKPGQRDWQPPVIIYQSPYFRSATANDIHLSIATTTSGVQTDIYLGWDLRARNRLFWTHSTDRGNTWRMPTELVSPSLEFGFDIPYQLQLQANQNQVIALWQLGAPGDHCTQYYLWSDDKGNSWQSPQMLFEQPVGCPSDNEMVVTGQGELLLFTRLNQQAYWLAWDGKTWSLPQPQREFSNFVDPETNRLLDLQCLQILENEGSLYHIGCDVNGSGDIWLVSQTLETTDAWFASPSSWSEPVTITSDPSPLASPQIVADSHGVLHAFWNLRTVVRSEPRASIHYAVWDGANWSLPVEILRPTRRNTYLYSVAINSDDTIFVVWESKDTRGISDGIFISWANSGDASDGSAWITTETLPDLGRYATSPEMVIDPDGRIYLSYSVPYNEYRGIYLISSGDDGRMWSQPSLIAATDSEEWEMVENPHLATSPYGDLVAIWTVSTFPPDSLPLALYSSSSRDGGVSWSTPEKISEKNVGWSQVIGLEQGNFQRLWQESEGDIQYIWYQNSYDGGFTWSSAENLLTTNDDLRSLATSVDAAGRGHLAMITEAPQGVTARPHLQNWTWDGTHWVGEQVLRLSQDVSIMPASLASTFTLDGNYATVYTEYQQTSSFEEGTYQLRFTRRSDELAIASAAELPSASEPTASPAPTEPITAPTETTVPPTASPAPSPVPTEAPGTPPLVEGNSAQPIPWTGIIIVGGILVIGSSLAAAGIWYRRKRQN